MRVARLLIERFRGIECLMWDPTPGVNCVVGPADAGKTSLLAAIELLLAPSQATVFEFDYWRRKVSDGFQISAILVDLPDEFVGAFRAPPLHGWLDGVLVEIPEGSAVPAVVAVARGLPDLEVEYVLVDPAGGETRLTTGHRRSLGVTRLQWDRTDIELRLSRGSLLQQHLGGDNMRPALGAALATASGSLELPADVSEKLQALDRQYKDAGLPGDLRLGLQSPRRESLLGLLGLLAGATEEEAVPFGLAGAGTKRLAAFELAATLRSHAQVVLVDEPEVGLEPYRQRRLLARLRELIGARGQAFLTTHSPAVLGGLRTGELIRLERAHFPIRFPPGALDKLLGDDPEALLSRLPVLCEGKTETGALLELLPHVAAMAAPSDLDALGVHLATRAGQPSILKESEALASAGVRHALFVDNEDTHRGTRERLGNDRHVVLGVWREIRNIEEAVARWLPAASMDALVELGAQLNNRSVDDLRQAVGEKAGLPGRRSFSELVAGVGEEQARRGIGEAMNRSGWFKTQAKGGALARFLISTGLPEPMRDVVADFWGRLRALLGS